MSEKRYQVFVSSTFTDLQEARHTVSHALLRSNCFPYGMELFPAADEEQFEFIKRVIKDSDFFIIISAGRYGSINTETKLSYTEMEYDYAVKIGKPIIRLLHRDPFLELKGRDIEASDQGRKKLRDFRQKLSNNRLVQFWSDFRELGQHVTFSLIEAQRRNNVRGWTRDSREVSEESEYGPEFIAAVQGAVRSLIGSTESKETVGTHVQEALEDLAAGIAEDFTEIIAAITGHCDLLLLRHEQGDHDYSDLVQINQNANRAAALVGQLIAFAGKQHLSIESVDLGSAAAELKHLLKRLIGENIHLTLLTEPNLNRVNVDRRMWDQVLMNLAVNARDAMPNGGTISVSFQNIPISDSPKLSKLHFSNEGYVCCKISDNGSGMTKDQMSYIFNPLFTTKNTGTGMGLSLARAIVWQSGGDIAVSSLVGKGTEFSIFLPAEN